MNKFKLNKKILAIFIMLFLILNISCGYKVFSATKVEKNNENKTTTTTITNKDGEKMTYTSSTNGEIIGTDNDPDVPWEEPARYEIVNNGCTFSGGALTYDLLCAHGDLLCSAHGVTLTNGGIKYEEAQASKGSTYDPSQVPDLTPIRTEPNFTASERKYANPEEAFILAYAQHETGSQYGEYTPAQLAWWQTSAGQAGVKSEARILENVAKTNSNVAGINAYSNDLFQFANSDFSEIAASSKSFATQNDISAKNTILTQTVGKTVNKTSQYGNLRDASREFQNYIIRAAGVSNVSEVQRQEDGYFKLNYNPQWINSKEKFENTTYDYSNPTVSFDGTDLIVGPFAIDYVYSEKFAYITDMYLETDDKDHAKLEYGKDWTINCKNKVKVGDKEYPNEKAPFYLVINNKYNATKITNFHIDFEYTNAKGAFNYFYGTIRETFTNKTETVEHTTDSEGNPITRTRIDWDIKVGEIPAQTLAGNIEAAITKFKASLDREISLVSSINIEKKIVDENGNPINVGENDTFAFKLEVTGAVNEDNQNSEKILVKGNSSASSKIYYWYTKGQEPTFKISELDYDQNKYEFVSIGFKDSEATGNEVSGKLESGKTIEIIAKNKIKKPKTGNLSIVKKAEESPLGTTDLINGKTFNFDITVSGTFKYKDGEYKEQTVVIPVSVVADGKSHNVIPDNEIKWYGNDAPKYSIKETNLPDGVEVVSVTPSEGGVLKEGGNVTVTAVNSQTSEKGKFVIIKTLTDAEKVYTEDEAKEKKFNFKVKVGNNEEEYVTTTQFTNENGVYKWTYTSKDYEWLKGQNPEYTITEVDNPEGTVFDEEATKNANPNLTVTANTVKGKLEAGTNESGKITNNIINKFDTNKHGNIKITKKIADKLLVDKSFDFVVTVTGSFRIKDRNGNYQYFKNESVQLTNVNKEGEESYIRLNDETDSKRKDTELVVIKVTSEGANEADQLYGMGEYTSDEFEWFGEAPKYKVEENLVGEDINHTIEPSEGILINKNDADTKDQLVQVTAWNGHDKVGYLHIYKKLENADKLPIDDIKNLKFTFKVSVTGYDDQIITLTPEQKGNEWIWEKTLKYSWSFDKEAPDYKLEEINFPEGTYLGSINNKEGKLVEGTTADNEIQLTDVAVINKIKSHKGDLTIKKDVTTDSLKGKEFEFKVTINGTFTYNGTQYTADKPYTGTIKVKGGETAKLENIEWYGSTAPSYVVEESESDIAKVISKTNDTGTLKCKECNSDATNLCTVTFKNASDKDGGYLVINKTLSNGDVTDKTFYFEIKIGTNEAYTISLKAGETYKSDYIEWDKADGAPEYIVKEINLPEGTEVDNISTDNGTVNGNEVRGKLNAKVTIKAVNKQTEHKGNFEIVKEIVDNKFLDAAQTSDFEFKIKISGTFKIDGHDKIHYAKDGEYEYTEKISVDLSKKSNKYTSPTITWWGTDAPTITVEEINLPQGWKQVGSISNNGASLLENETITFTATNEMPVYVELDLTIQLAGEVWEDVPQDSGKNMKESVPNGKIDSNESKIKGVQVYVYRVAIGNNTEINRKLATVYENDLGLEKEFPLLTSEDGIWNAERIKIEPLTDDEKAQGATAVKYDVEFVYDGQTYEPTIFLSKDTGDGYTEGSASEYINASTSGRDAYADKSMAKDYDREIVNNRIASVSGNTPIDGNGDTVGNITSSDGIQNNVYYESKVQDTNGTRVKSTVKTTDENGVALDVFKAKARTSVGGLEYPFDNRTHLTNYDTVITDYGLVQRYTYSATYNYCLHINLGLVRRPEADVEASKDLYSAKVIVKGKELDYKFNKLADMNKNVLERQIEQIDSQNITYELGLYKTDYYYRAEIYRTNSQVYDNVSKLYKEINGGINASELEVYLTYRIGLYNSSGSYIAQINSIDDYVDSSFGAPINADEKNIVNNVEKVVAGKSYMLINGTRSNEDLNWNTVEKNIKGSDGITYNKMTLDLNNVKLASGEKAEIYVTFKLQKSDIDGVQNAIELGDKSNIVEISNYTTYYKDGKIAGKIDKDSAPANINIRDYNTKAWYEDDTDAAPVLKLGLLEENREINGTAWEDKAENNSAVGNGIRDDDEALIGGLTTELVEKITVDGIDYDFLWPTNQSLDFLGGKTLEYVTGGFATTTETSRTNPIEKDSNGNVTKEGNTDGLHVGEYKFTNVPTGTYVVRFIYGNDKSKLEDTSKIATVQKETTDSITGTTTQISYLFDANALKADGSNYYDGINTANYDNDLVGKTPAVYNGQDYKTTIYQGGNNISNAWHDLSNSNIATTNYSDAKDSESRRLQVIANSQTITNINGNVLATANNKDNKHTDLYNDYYMYADTAKLNLNIEAKDVEGLAGVNSEEVQGKILSNDVILVNKDVTNYTISKIDLGLIERPETAIVLDKQINEIKLTTNDNKVIFDAIYDINYEKVTANKVDELKDKVVIAQLSDNEYLIANVNLNTEKSIGADALQALNKNELKLSNKESTGTQNFRFVNVDETILQGTTVEINYTITALNVSEEDYTSEILYNATNKEDAKSAILELAKQATQDFASSNETTNTGKYLGTYYYTGKASESDRIVKSKVRQLVDYVDNDAVFTTSYNESNDHMWRNTTITELTGSGLEENRLIDKTVIPGFDLVDENSVKYAEKQELKDSNGVPYVTETRNNLILSVDDKNSNGGFEKELVPVTKATDTDPYTSQIILTITKTVSAQDDANNMRYDNLAEIVKFENTVGRRDTISIAGNANPGTSEIFKTSLSERDQSATELVTFTPPTGIEATTSITAQVLIIVIISLGIVAVGIVVIKKKVLNK